MSNDHHDPLEVDALASAEREELVEDVEVVLSPARFRRHRFMLIVAMAIVGAAFIFRVPSNDRVELTGLSGVPMPSMCLSKSLWGIECPGCGLTRSVLCFFQGHFANSFALHRLGWLMAVAILVQFPYRIWGLVYKEDYPLGKRFASGFAFTLIFLLIANWLVGFFL